MPGMSKYLSRIGFSAAARSGSVGPAAFRLVMASFATSFTKAERSAAAKAGVPRKAAPVSAVAAVMRRVRRLCMGVSVRFAHKSQSVRFAHNSRSVRFAHNTRSVRFAHLGHAVALGGG